MMAYKEGYRFSWIEGEMWEKSPFTIWDFLQQRKRWIQGIYLVVHSNLVSYNFVHFAISNFSNPTPAAAIILPNISI